MFENKQRTEIESLGEFGLMQHLFKNVEKFNSTTLSGAGDDAAVIEQNNENLSLLGSTLWTEGVNFDLSYTPLKHLGYKLVVSGISQVAAMNGTATNVLISAGISNRVSLEAMEEFFEGVALACNKYQVDLSGGDITSTRSGIVFSISSYGIVDKKKICYRNGAKKGDLLCVSGDLGAAYMGLQVLEREKRVFLEHPNMQPDLDGHDYILQRQLKPEARTDINKLLADLEILPGSMISVTDGVGSEAMHLSKASDIGIFIYEEKLPIDPVTFNIAREFDIDPTVVALNGGEDFELLFTLSQTDYDKIKNNMDITIIGYCTDDHSGVKLITKGGNVHDMKAPGWQAQ